ncbi:hypothetical protein [Brevibacterium sp. XM4083]|uniref:hypothetical protein n=1 Tax=Brevibacterium sp. XM4083 TaxID=2583238 RepID=UPI0011268935|nr:hypothetical protein [Brevibacterium sp. XM4083]MCM1011104.1 hypothetical protein [Brevibacterium sp. XM4083]
MTDSGTGDLPIIGTPASGIPVTPPVPDRSAPYRAMDGGSGSLGGSGSGHTTTGSTGERPYAIPTGFPSVPFGRRRHPGRRR